MSWWRTLAPPLKVGVGVIVSVAVAGVLYVIVTLVLIGLANLGIGESCKPSC
jgi:hypothetical protein